MDALVSLPENFSEIFKLFLGKEIGLSCTQGRKVYCGTLQDTYRKGITVQVNGFYRTIPFNILSSLTPSIETNLSPETTFKPITSDLAEKYKNFLYQEVIISRKKNRAWDERGEIKHIGNDYFVLRNPHDNVLVYVNANIDFEIELSH